VLFKSSSNLAVLGYSFGFLPDASMLVTEGITVGFSGQWEAKGKQRDVLFAS
jgi:hypothetical protein